MVEKVLKTLPKKFEAIVASIEECKGLSQLSIEGLLESLLSHESRINMNNDSDLQNAFKYEVSISIGRDNICNDQRDDKDNS